MVARGVKIFVDLEYCFPEMTAEYGRPTDKNLRQVVQISAIKYDMKNGIEVEAFDVLTRPVFLKELPQFFVELTGITQEILDRKAVNFVAGYTAFIEFCRDNLGNIYTFDQDWYVLKQNLEYLDIDYDFEEHPFTRVKPMLRKWGLVPDAYSSGTLYKAAGIDMEGQVHNALHDVRSMAAAYRHFMIADS